jgi:hypothetical protein
MIFRQDTRVRIAWTGLHVLKPIPDPQNPTVAGASKRLKMPFQAVLPKKLDIGEFRA